MLIIYKIIKCKTHLKQKNDNWKMSKKMSFNYYERINWSVLFIFM